MGFRKGQGATEYLVLLAVVLIIALVSIALLGFFPGLAGDAKITQSNAYWQGEAQPFQIKDNAQAGTVMQMVLLNSQPQPLTLNSITLTNPDGTNSTPTTVNKRFAGGQEVTLTNVTAQSCTAGDTYEYNVAINYTTSSGLVKPEIGTKTLIGKCG